jgi:signal transduction histidine kinase
MKRWIRSVCQWWTGTRTQIVLGGILFMVLAVLVYMAGRTGQEEFDKSRQALESIETLNVQLDGAVSWSMFEFQMDFDSIAAMQRALREEVAEFYALFPYANPALSGGIDAKMVALEDFKTTQSILRNSRSIASSLIEQLREEAEAAGDGGAAHFSVERDYLNFLSRRDPPAGAALRATVEKVGLSDNGLSSAAAWPTLENHLLKLVDLVERIGLVMGEMYSIPVPQQIDAHFSQIGDRLSHASVVAGRYRAALFVVSVTLLVFSGFMVGRVRRYLKLIKRSNDELEARVALRTQELANVNETLLAEIAERENVESQLHIARKLESIGQLAAGIAHEINTPAQYVSDNVTFLEGMWREVEPLLDDYEKAVQAGVVDGEKSRELLASTDLGFLRDEVPAAFSEAASGLRQVSQIILAMKSFSHPGSDGIQPADINEALESTVTVARNEWKYVADLTLDLDRKLPAVPCDVSAFNQVVLNLVVNAAQAIGEMRGDQGGGHIKVSSRQYGNFVEICVEDNGPGIPESIRDRIFDPFFTTKEVGKGTGQGLAISHRVIHQQHEGTLTVESTEGEGARFVIRLPLRLPERESFEPTLEASDSVHARGAKRAAV